MIGNKWFSGVLRDKASDGDGSGGGGDQTPVTIRQVQELVDKTINGVVKRLEGETKKSFSAFESKFDVLIAKLEKGTGGDDETDGDDETPPVDGTRNKAKVDPALKAQLDQNQREIAKLLKRVSDSDAARDASAKKSEETERYSAIKSELSKYPILAESVEDAFDLFKGRVSRNEDGTLIVGETTMEAHIKSVLDRNTGLLRPADKAGAGATPGSRGTRLGLEDIKPGMSADDEAAIMAQISAAMPR